MAKVQALFLLLVISFSLCVFSLELAPHHHHHNHHRRHHHHHHSPLHPSPAHPPHHHRHHHHHHHHSHAPAKPQTHHHPLAPAPSEAPTHHIYTNTLTHVPLQVHPPAVAHPIPKGFVAVEGYVYTKSCKNAYLNTISGATPLPGAIVKLECNITRNPLIQTAKTTVSGKFFLLADKSITTDEVHKCKVFLVSTTFSYEGQLPSNYNDGITGATLRPQKPIVSKNLHFFLYNVGPLAFEPLCAY
ncbi:hypothetical protein Lal_00041248 [Lupinus albus]|nr:hypothetical protein Lal_00041248 [Lupinus albus]